MQHLVHTGIPWDEIMSAVTVVEAFDTRVSRADASADISLPVRQRSTGELARRHTEAWLAEWDLSECADVVKTIIGELIQNVVKHTDSALVTVVLAWHTNDHRLLITVGDTGRAMPGTHGPWVRRCGATAEFGRGLALVADLTEQAWFKAKPDAGLNRYALLNLDGPS